MLSNIDFTLGVLKRLYSQLIRSRYSFQTFSESITQPTDGRVVILRHDVDARKKHSLQFAMIQNRLGIKGTYYFRVVPASFDIGVIKQIADLGHEIGYHYETMDTARGNVDRAYSEFCKNLDLFREIVPVTTVCMHGSPLSKFDNRDIWKKYDYQSLGIIGEPYFDLDFNSTFYITDTGRRWDGAKVSIRDKAMTGKLIEPDFLSRRYHATHDIIGGLVKNEFPDRVMMTFHPQRWTNNPYEWCKEFVIQNIKNVVKKRIVGKMR